MDNFNFEEEIGALCGTMNDGEEMGRVFSEGHQIIITAKTDEVLEALRTNRKKHINDFEDAKKAYFVAAEKLLKKELGRIKEGKFRSLGISLSIPMSYEKQYDTAIRMFELHKNADKETIELNSNQVDSLVHDVWDWTSDFKRTVGSYMNI